MPPLSPFSPRPGLATPVMASRRPPSIFGTGRNIITEGQPLFGGGGGRRARPIQQPFKEPPAVAKEQRTLSREQNAAAVRGRLEASRLKDQERAQNLKDMKAFQRVKSPQSEQIRQELGREGIVLRPAQGGTTQSGVRGIEVVKQGKGSVGQIIMTEDKFLVGQRGTITGEFNTFNEAMRAFLKK